MGETLNLKELVAKATPDNPLDLELVSVLAAGDAAVMTAAVRSLHDCYPGRFRTAVKTCTNNQVWIGNPLITPIEEMTNPVTVEANYPAIHKSNQNPWHFIIGYVDDLAEKLGLPIKLTHFKPDLYMTDEEKSVRPIDEKYWLVLGGGKPDYGTKLWSPNRWQDVVNMLKNDVTFVQAGMMEHDHNPLKNAIDVRGQTTLRQLMQLVYHSDGVLCPVTCAMHFAAGYNKPCVVVAYAGEAEHWEAYTHESRLSTMKHYDPDWTPPADDNFVPHIYLRGKPLEDCVDHEGWGCWKSKIMTGEIRERCRWLRNEHGTVYAGCLNSVSQERVSDSIRNYHSLIGIKKPQEDEVVEVDGKPVMHVFANMKILGGGERSILTIMDQLKDNFRIKFWSLNGVHENYRPELYSVASEYHVEWDEPVIHKGEHVLFYMNDSVPKISRDQVRWERWLEPAASIQISINFMLSGMHKLEWLAPKCKMIYFQNSDKQNDWLKDIKKREVWQSVPTMVMDCAADLTGFDTGKNLNKTDRVIVGRVSGNAAPCPDNAAEMYLELAEALPNAEFWFMPIPSQMKDVKHPRIRLFERDEVPVKDFMSSCDIFALSIKEGFHVPGPRVLMEAMRAGCCPVALNFAGPKDRMTNGKNGVLCDNLKDMQAQIIELCNDPVRRKALGKAAQDHSQGWSLSTWRDNITNSALGNGKPESTTTAHIGVVDIKPTPISKPKESKPVKEESNVKTPDWIVPQIMKRWPSGMREPVDVAIVINVLDSHEVVRRQLTHFNSIIPSNWEVVIVDDGSDVAIEPLDVKDLKYRLKVVRTFDKRPWTQPSARNIGYLCAESSAKYFVMTDVDHILTADNVAAVEEFRKTEGSKMMFGVREYGVLDENATISTDRDVLLDYGCPEKEVDRGIMGGHYNSFCVSRSAYEQIGGYDLKFCGNYGGDDTDFSGRFGKAYHAKQISGATASTKSLMYVFPDPRADKKRIFHHLRWAGNKSKHEQYRVGLMALYKFPMWKRSLTNLLQHVDAVYLRFDGAARDADWSIIQEARNICGEKLQRLVISYERWNRFNWREDLLRLLDDVKPELVLFPDEDEEFGDNIEQDIADFMKADDCGQAIFNFEMVTEDNVDVAVFPKDPHMKMFKWKGGLTYKPYPSYARLRSYNGQPFYRAKSKIQHLCLYNEELRKNKKFH